MKDWQNKHWGIYSIWVSVTRRVSISINISIAQLEIDLIGVSFDIEKGKQSNYMPNEMKYVDPMNDPLQL